MVIELEVFTSEPERSTHMRLDAFPGISIFVIIISAKWMERMTRDNVFVRHVTVCETVRSGLVNETSGQH